MSKISPRCSTRSKPFRVLLPAILISTFLGLCLSAAASLPEQERAREIVSDSRFQTELPEEEVELKLPAPGMAAFVRYILYGLVALGIGLLAWWLIDEFSATYGRAGIGGGKEGDQDELERDPFGIEDPERLAGEGRYDEAIHALLLTAIALLSRRLPSPPGPACTSRELARILPMNRESRESFEDLVSAVEASLFGGMPARPDSYARCRRNYLLLAEGGES